MLKIVTHITTKYSEKGEQKLDKAFEFQEPTEEEKEDRRIAKLTGQIDYEEDDSEEIKTIEFTDEDFILLEQKGLIDTSDISYAHETEDGYTSIMTKQDKTVIIKESSDYVIPKNIFQKLLDFFK